MRTARSVRKIAEEASTELLTRADSGTSRPFRHLRRQLHQLSLAAQEFAEERDAQRLASCIARHACQLLNVDYASVAFYANGRPDITAACRGGTSCTVDEPSVVRVLVDQVLQEHSPRLAVGDSNEGQDWQDILVVPVKGLHRKVIATIVFVNKKTEQPMSDTDVAAAVGLARISSAAVDRARLFGHLHEWSRSLEMLLSFNAAVNQRLEPPQMVRQLLENAARFLKAGSGVVGLVVENPRGEKWMECEGRWEGGQWHAWSRRWHREEGMPGFVLESEFPYFASIYRHDPLADPDLAAQEEVHRCVCVPIKSMRGEVLGFFQLHRPPGEPEFTWQEAAFLESLGNTAAVAIENARLVESLEARNREIKRLSAEHVHRLEEERRHISRELHDEAGQALIGLKLGIQVLSGLLPEEAREAHAHLEALRGQLNESATRIKELATRLRPPVLDELGFPAALRQLALDFQQRLGLRVSVEIADDVELGNLAATSLYRIAQEALTNVSKHAQTDRAYLALHCDGNGDLVMVVRDEGRGFALSHPSPGLGLSGMKERVKMLHGRWSIESEPGRGTVLTVRVPRDG